MKRRPDFFAAADNRAFLPGIAALLIGFAGFASAGNFSPSARGTTAADFLNIGVGARAIALGEAFTAAADNADAVYWNPAAMTRVQRRSITLMHASYISTSYFDYGAYVHNADRWGTFGLGAQYYSAGKITQTDATGADVGVFSPYDMALYWSYAREVKDSRWFSGFNGYSFGLSVKLIDSRIFNAASAAAVDAGMLSRTYCGGKLRFAAVASNLGGDTLQFDQVKERLPMTLKAGSAYKLNEAWSVSLDGGFPKSDRPFGAFGTEYWLKNAGTVRFAGRAGFNSRTVGSIDGFTGVSMGFGVAIGGWFVDYAFVPIGGLGQAHRISLTYNF